MAYKLGVGKDSVTKNVYVAWCDGDGLPTPGAIVYLDTYAGGDPLSKTTIDTGLQVATNGVSGQNVYRKVRYLFCQDINGVNLHVFSCCFNSGESLGGNVMSTPDFAVGNWNAFDWGCNSEEFSDIIYENGTLVCYGDNDVAGDRTYKYVASTDGVSWNGYDVRIQLDPQEPNEPRSLVVPNMRPTVDSDGNIYIVRLGVYGSKPEIYKSTDGGSSYFSFFDLYPFLGAWNRCQRTGEIKLWVVDSKMYVSGDGSLWVLDDLTTPTTMTALLSRQIGSRSNGNYALTDWVFDHLTGNGSVLWVYASEVRREKNSNSRVSFEGWADDIPLWQKPENHIGSIVYQSIDFGATWGERYYEEKFVSFVNVRQFEGRLLGIVPWGDSDANIIELGGLGGIDTSAGAGTDHVKELKTQGQMSFFVGESRNSEEAIEWGDAMLTLSEDKIGLIPSRTKQTTLDELGKIGRDFFSTDTRLKYVEPFKGTTLDIGCDNLGNATKYSYQVWVPLAGEGCSGVPGDPDYPEARRARIDSFDKCGRTLEMRFSERDLDMNLVTDSFPNHFAPGKTLYMVNRKAGTTRSRIHLMVRDIQWDDTDKFYTVEFRILDFNDGGTGTDEYQLPEHGDIVDLLGTTDYNGEKIYIPAGSFIPSSNNSGLSIEQFEDRPGGPNHNAGMLEGMAFGGNQDDNQYQVTLNLPINYAGTMDIHVHFMTRDGSPGAGGTMQVRYRNHLNDESTYASQSWNEVNSSAFIFSSNDDYVPKTLIINDILLSNYNKPTTRNINLYDIMLYSLNDPVPFDYFVTGITVFIDKPRNQSDLL